jgi:hypothetical protein
MISRGYDGKLPSVQSQLVAKQEILIIIATLFFALVLAIFGRNFL